MEARILAGTNPGQLHVAEELTSSGSTESLFGGSHLIHVSVSGFFFAERGIVSGFSAPPRPLPPPAHLARRFVSRCWPTLTLTVRFDTRRIFGILRRQRRWSLGDKPDFVVFLGDEAGIRYRRDPVNFMNQQRAIERWRLWRSLFASLLADVPSYLVLGNHEGEAGYYRAYEFQGRTLHYQRWGATARKQLCLNPLPNTYPEGGENEGWSDDAGSGATQGLRSGNCSPLQNYFAWTWGDALFVVLDVHRYTNVGGTYPRTVDEWTLGSSQLQWMERVLTVSKARWKFVFAHHLVGGYGWDVFGRKRNTNYVYGRGGARYAHVGEQVRITRIMNSTGAKFFFYGHDHVFAHQQAAGIHFICCGRPTRLDSAWWQNAGWREAYGDVDARDPHDFYAAIGYTRITVSPDNVTVEYVRSGTDMNHAENVVQPVGQVVYRLQVPCQV